MPCTKCTKTSAIIEEWLNQQGHNRCWYYPELFRQLADLYGCVQSAPSALPPLEEFRRGCTRYQEEEYNLFPHTNSTSESNRQKDKEDAVLLALQHDLALIRRGLEIHGMKKDGTTECFSRSTSYDTLWSDALDTLRETFG